MQVRVRLFASLREITGREELSIPIDAHTTGEDLESKLIKQYPRLKTKLPICRLAVNMEFVDKNTRLNNEDEVVFIAPVSGGAHDKNYKCRD